MSKSTARSSLLGHPLKREHHHIIGAGISGLLLGFFLKRAGHSFTIYEITSRAGGLLGSVRKGGALFERAANGFLWTQAMQDVADELGLKMHGPDQAARARYLLRNGRMRRMPLGPLELVGAMGKMMIPRRANCETVEDFGLKYFGEKMTRQVMEPAFAGIYGGQTAELSFSGVMEKLAEVQTQSSWLPAGLYRLYSERKRNNKKDARKSSAGTHCFEGGTQELIDALVSHLKDHLSFEATKLPTGAASVIHCTPAYAAASHFDGALKTMLEEVNYLPMLSASLLVPAADFPDFRPGFGLLIPRSEGINCLGVLFNHCIFPNRVASDGAKMLNLTCIFRDEEGSLLAAADKQVLEEVYADLEKLFGARSVATEFAIHRWPQGIPAYSPALVHNWAEIDRQLKASFPIHRLFGNYTGQISIRGMAEQAKLIAAAV